MTAEQDQPSLQPGPAPEPAPLPEGTLRPGLAEQLGDGLSSLVTSLGEALAGLFTGLVSLAGLQDLDGLGWIGAASGLILFWFAAKSLYRRAIITAALQAALGLAILLAALGRA